MANHFRTLLIVGMIALSLSVTVVSRVAIAGPSEDGVAAYDREDYVAALAIFHPLAEQGDKVAQVTLSRMYLRGLGVTRDEKEALKWARLAAAHGDAEAQNYIGQVFAMGTTGVEKNEKESVRWFGLAAAQGNADAQLGLGLMYASGRGVGKDEKEAVKWYRLAAKQGDMDAQRYLGVTYFYGLGVARDYVVAYKWLHLAAARGDANTTRWRDIVAAKLTPTETEDAEMMAYACKQSKYKNCD